MIRLVPSGRIAQMVGWGQGIAGGLAQERGTAQQPLVGRRGESLHDCAGNATQRRLGPVARPRG